MRKAFLSLLAILWNSTFRCLYHSFSPLLFASLLFTAICKASPRQPFCFFCISYCFNWIGEGRVRAGAGGPGQRLLLLWSKQGQRPDPHSLSFSDQLKGIRWWPSSVFQGSHLPRSKSPWPPPGSQGPARPAPSPPSPPRPPSLPLLLCSSHAGLLAVPPTPSCPRSFACCVLAAPNPAIGPSNPSPSSFRSFSETTSSVTCFDDGRTNCHNPHRRQFSHIYPDEKEHALCPSHFISLLENSPTSVISFVW